MYRRTYTPVLMVISLLMTVGLAQAADMDAVHSGKVAPAKKTHSKARIKLVNLNGASKDELMKLPGIHAAEADRIIAGRPYGSKAWLVTKKIIPENLYYAIEGKIVAKQDKKTLDAIFKGKAVTSPKK